MRKKLSLLALIVFICGIGFLYSFSKIEYETIEYVQLQDMINKSEIEKIAISNKLDAKFIVTDVLGNKYQTQNFYHDGLLFELYQKGIYSEVIYPFRIVDLVPSLIIITGLIAGYSYIFYKQKHMMKQDSSLVKGSNKESVSFIDIGGLDEVKNELKILVDFLKYPEKYGSQSIRLPKGILLEGPSGTGKTMLAKAIASETNTPFYYVDSSALVELFVGVGASRLRSIFKQARKHSKAIIFLDEIDSFATKRNNHDGSTEDIKTLNTLLQEMDGFKPNDNIIVISATNRVESLDPALLRAGRFDRHIIINYPDKKGRAELIKIYSKNRTFADDIDFEQIISITAGMTGADIETIFNEAGILSIYDGVNSIHYRHITDAINKRISKGYKKDFYERSEEETELTAYHEAGHALVAMLCGIAVSRVSITPYTNGAGGTTLIDPEEKMLNKGEILQRVMMLYGGRVGEFILTGKESLVTSGASTDIKKATEYLYAAISEYGMGKYPLYYTSISPRSNQPYLSEIQNMSKLLYEKTIELLKLNKPCLDKIASELINNMELSNSELLHIYDYYCTGSDNNENGTLIDTDEFQVFNNKDLNNLFEH